MSKEKETVISNKEVEAMRKEVRKFDHIEPFSDKELERFRKFDEAHREEFRKAFGTSETVRVSIPVTIEEDDDGFYVRCYHLPGLHVGGETFEEALKNAEDGADLYIYSLMREDRERRRHDGE